MKGYRGVKRMPTQCSLPCYWQDANPIPKSQWIDLYFDLYRQVFQDDTPEEVVMADVKARLKALGYR